MTFIPGIVRPPDEGGGGEWYLVKPRGIVVALGSAGPSIPGDAAAAALGVDLAAAHYLGTRDGRAVLALPAPDGDLPEGYKLVDLRSLFGVLGEVVFALAARAAQIVTWADNHRYCGRCGTPTERSATERCIHCPRCNLDAYPRVSPAVIVLVRRGREALLARNARFPGTFYSTLAGFVE